MQQNTQNDLHFIPADEVVLPPFFPKVFESNEGELFVYLGAILNNGMRMGLNCSPYWAYKKHSTDELVQEGILGFYRLKSGVIFKDEFIDGETHLPFEVAEKNEYVDLPKGPSTYFGIHAYETHEENSEDTRKAFGLTYDELSDVLRAYGCIFELGDAYSPQPRITRSNQRNNCCDLSYAWIPAGFPYIAFDTNEYPFSHVSLGAFYGHLRLLLLHDQRSKIWQNMIALGVAKDILAQITEMELSWHPPVRYNEFLKL